MKNWKGDLLWASLLLIWIVMLIIPDTRTAFIKVTEANSYVSGFVKFFILASMGDLLGERILKGEWHIPHTFLLKGIVWGVMGMLINLVFTVFTEGVAAAQLIGKLPFEGSKLAQALFGSTLMNVTFGPMLYIYHKFGDLFIDMVYEKKEKNQVDKITLSAMVERVNWYRMVSFSWMTTCIFIWIPCHTIVFLLPSEYRVLASAFLSILLGILIAISNKYKSR
ncbi:MAG TPA: hypothetical protein VEA58_05775 [Anaerovoracaceae bacterium]|nr:hypothetical protein [Anaerovoracaceae bacterium]